MSKIISETYSIKLQSIIDEFEISADLTSLIDFFLDEIQKDQNRKGNRNQKVFSDKELEKLKEIKNLGNLKRIFVYINKIITAFSGRYLQIHINENLSENLEENLISLITWNEMVSGLYNHELLENQLRLLKSETDRDLIIPIDKNGHATNQIFRNSLGLKHKLRYIKKIKSLNNNGPKNGVLINLNSSGKGSVNISDFFEFPDSLNRYINYGESLQYIYDSNNSILENIQTIINLFPAERGINVWYQDFIKENIDTWNQLPEFNFKKVITITSGEKTQEALLEMHKLNKFQAEEIYILFSFEF